MNRTTIITNSVFLITNRIGSLKEYIGRKGGGAKTVGINPGPIPNKKRPHLRTAVGLVVDRGFNKPYFPQKCRLIFNNIQIEIHIKNSIFVPYLSRDGSG